MIRDVLTAAPDTPVGELAELLERNGIKRVPIMKDDKIVGIVSRANLLQALVQLRKHAAGRKPATDEALREAVLAHMDAEPWMRTSLISVTAHNGAIDISGIVESQNERTALRVAAEITPGVHVVNDSVTVRAEPMYKPSAL